MMKNNLREWIKAHTWQPIDENPPREGRSVVLAHFRKARHDYDQPFFLDCIYMGYGYFRKHGQGCAQKKFIEGFYIKLPLYELRHVEPTHWMPLPDTETSDMLAQFDALQAKADLVDEMVRTATKIDNDLCALGALTTNTSLTERINKMLDTNEKALAKYAAIMEENK